MGNNKQPDPQQEVESSVKLLLWFLIPLILLILYGIFGSG